MKADELFLNGHYLLQTILVAWGILLKVDEYLIKKRTNHE